MTSQRQRGQPEAGHPALGPVPEQPQIVLIDPQLEPFQKLLRLGDRERHGSALRISSRRPAMRSLCRRREGSARVASTRRMRSGAARAACRDLASPPGRPPRGSRRGPARPARAGLQPRHEGGQEGVEVAASRRRARGTARPARCKRRRPRSRRVGASWPQGLAQAMRRETLPPTSCPARQQGGLAGPGRRRDQSQRPLDRTGELLRQARPLHHARGNGRHHEPRRQNQLPLLGISRVRVLLRRVRLMSLSGCNEARTTEIWTTVIDGQAYICGTPNGSQPGIERSPETGSPTWWPIPSSRSGSRRTVHVDLPASAARVDDPTERQRVLDRTEHRVLPQRSVVGGGHRPQSNGASGVRGRRHLVEQRPASPTGRGLSSSSPAPSLRRGAPRRGRRCGRGR